MSQYIGGLTRVQYSVTIKHPRTPVSSLPVRHFQLINSDRLIVIREDLIEWSVEKLLVSWSCDDSPSQSVATLSQSSVPAVPASVRWTLSQSQGYPASREEPVNTARRTTSLTPTSWHFHILVTCNNKWNLLSKHYKVGPGFKYTFKETSHFSRLTLNLRRNLKVRTSLYRCTLVSAFTIETEKKEIPTDNNSDLNCPCFLLLPQILNSRPKFGLPITCGNFIVQKYFLGLLLWLQLETSSPATIKS